MKFTNYGYLAALNQKLVNSFCSFTHKHDIKEIYFIHPIFTRLTAAVNGDRKV